MQPKALILIIATAAFALAGCQTMPTNMTPARYQASQASSQAMIDLGLRLMNPPRQPVYFAPMRQPVNCYARHGAMTTTINCY